VKQKHPQADSNPEIEAKVQFELVEAAYRQTPFTLAMAVVFSCGLFAALYPVFPTPDLYGWLAANNLVSLGRYLLIRNYRRQAPDIRARLVWRRRFVLGTFAAGVVWGLLGTMFYPPHGDPAQNIASASLVGICAVALFSLSILYEAFLALIVPVLIPPIVSLSTSGFGDDLVMSLALLLFLGIAAANGRRNTRNVAENLRLRFQLAHAVDESLAASRAKSMFLASVSHEIRTPLNGILGIAQLLRGQVKEHAVRRHLDLLYGAGEHLLGLINDILDFSKVEAGKLKLQEADFDFRAKVHEVTDVLAERAREAGLRFTLHIDEAIPRLVRGDPVRVQQMLNNLVGNAIKFTADGFITLSVKKLGGAQLCRELTSDEAFCVAFDVADTGIGINSEDQKRIFDAFSQADNSFSRKYQGTGLGLAICRELAELMGGKLSVQSELGKGSTFSFTASFAPASPESVVAIDATKPGVEMATGFAGAALLVEDTPINQIIAQATLEDMGLEVAVAGDGETALQLAMERSFDVILMDVFLPVVDGYEATRRIRAADIRRPSGDAVPIVAVTANASQEDKERCLAAGMDDYLAKPYRKEQLHALLAKWLPRTARDIEDAAIVPLSRKSGLAPEEIERLYRSGSPRLMEGLRQAIKKHDMDALARHAHSLKSASAHVDARELSWACATLESAARAGDTAVAATTFGEVVSLYRDVRERLAGDGPADASLSMDLDCSDARAHAGYKTVLVVDDQPDDLVFLRRILENLGYAAEVCTSGEAALDICRSAMPDMIVLDGVMPGLGGIETCRCLRTDDRGRDVPIIFVSGNESREWQEAAYSAGADSVIKKAVSIDELDRTLVQAISRACLKASQRRSEA
jgi:two-component system, sensor histidine kinase